MNRLLRSQDGWAVLTAMMVMSAMLLIGAATVTLVDGETRSSLRERQTESRLNLTEGALATELYNLSHSWPTTGTYPDCTNASTAAPCFTAAQLKANFSSVDLNKLNPTWKVQVRDDVGAATQNGTCDPSQSNMGGYYSDAAVLAGTTPAYDANKNCQLWVRAEGTLDGKKRVVVAKVRVDTRPVQFPIAPFVSGSFTTGNNGNKIIVDGAGHAGQVRCADLNASTCVNYRPGQLTSPGNVESASGDFAGANVLDPAVIDALRKTAQQNGTYYQTCPSNATGAVVFVEKDYACDFQSGDTNPVTKQGIFVLYEGAMKITANGNWYGAIYVVNHQNSSDVLVDIKGTPTVHGGIFVDGNGGLNVGSSKQNLVYDPTVFPPMQAYGTAGIIQNTWRELTAG